MKWTKFKKQSTGIFLTLPCFLFILMFVAYPLFRTIYLSFFNYNPLQSLEATFAGINNYRWLIKGNTFSNSLYVTFLFTIISVIIEALLGLFIAALISNYRDGGKVKKIASAILMGIFILPWAIPGISSSLSWKMLYDPLFGPINAILGKTVLWLANSKLALFSIIIADTWRCTPYFIVIFLAAIVGISKEQLEAASADGATKIQSFIHVVLPAIWPVAFVACIFRAIDAFTKIFDLVYVLTGGGPGSKTEMLPIIIYKTALKYFNFGHAAVLSVAAIIISLVLGIWLLRKKNENI